MSPTHYFEPADGRFYVAHDPADGLYYTYFEHIYWGGIDGGTGVRVVIPKGTATDLASVPFPFSLLVPRAGRYNYAAGIHDQLYKEQLVEREVADAIFRSLMRRHGVNFFVRSEERRVGKECRSRWAEAQLVESRAIC